MTKSGPGLAKIRKPLLTAHYPRQRLFESLKRACQHPVVWITGPAGSGKTALAAGFIETQSLSVLWYRLDARDSDLASFFYCFSLAAETATPGRHTPLPGLPPEYVAGIPGFTRNFFETLYARLKTPFLVVLDNYQALPADAPFHDMLSHALAVLPAGGNVMVLSRRVPPAAFTRLSANQSMVLLGPDELQLTPEETCGIARLNNKGRFSDADCQVMFDRSQGWAAGLMLLLNPSSSNIPGHEFTRPDSPRTVFDYFASEIFDPAEKEDRDFLLKSAVLSRVTAEQACILTGQVNAGHILDTLVRRNFFITRHDGPPVIYQYHQLFREFLLERSHHDLPEKEREALSRRATGLLEEADRVEEAVSLLGTTGGYEALAAITAGDMPAADDLLCEPGQAIGSSACADVALYHFAACWSALLKGDLQLASVHGRAGMESACRANTGYTIAVAHFGMAIIAIQSDHPGSATEHLEKMREQGLPANNRLIEFMYLLMRAKMALDAGANDAVALLQKALELGARNDFVNFYFFMPAMVAALCVTALQHGIETAYVKSLIHRRGLVPESPPLQLADWPWRVEIYALGRFSVVVDGTPLRHGGKSQKKPLELLKALIALGGREVCEERLSEALWPDAEGDMAHSTFTTTLSRLRKLLPGEVLTVRDGCLSLDDRFCRLDTWAFERLLGELEHLLSAGRQEVEQVQRLMQDVFDLYHGPLLDKEAQMSWMLGPREHLRLKLLRVIKRLIAFYGRTGHCRQVIALYEKALEQDQLAEEYYRGLMRCHAGQGDRAEALAVYNNCRNLFRATFNMAPSEKTEQLHRLIKTGDRQHLSHLCDACRLT